MPVRPITVIRQKLPTRVQFYNLLLWEAFLDTADNACIKMGIDSYIRIGESKSWSPPIGTWEVTPIDIIEITVRLR